uniref:Uncharacterized protein n=1 Tax=Candidatus Kentrum sp. FM TaxID=2126340 RepID=A0A450SN75_9GAMM|nr:MAG: hypothetical protein BECKFM1743A_GA0114220_101353 [Candidatus Kentron sp. FM]VFJ55171.1 MAG: hypothetical protein BECKFM1743C_GA0114222_101525 [Candidatus Kentron sp. FM]VFK09214.1 MAG: hypothetical protein BECKFM1743B_GA0114221_100986 [Candidatus Kentron sp. FM]
MKKKHYVFFWEAKVSRRVKAYFFYLAMILVGNHPRTMFICVGGPINRERFSFPVSMTYISRQSISLNSGAATLSWT